MLSAVTPTCSTQSFSRSVQKPSSAYGGWRKGSVRGAKRGRVYHEVPRKQERGRVASAPASALTEAT